MKELEVKIKMAKLLLNRQHVFCPLIKMACRTDCESFVKPEIYNINNNEINSYNIQGGYCQASCLHSIGD